MLLTTLMVCLLISISLGKRAQAFGLKQYLIAGILALIQVGVALYYMFNMEKPPQF